MGCSDRTATEQHSNKHASRAGRRQLDDATVVQWVVRDRQCTSELIAVVRERLRLATTNERKDARGLTQRCSIALLRYYPCCNSPHTIYCNSTSTHTTPPISPRTLAGFHTAHKLCNTILSQSLYSSTIAVATQQRSSSIAAPAAVVVVVASQPHPGCCYRYLCCIRASQR